MKSKDRHGGRGGGGGGFLPEIVTSLFSRVRLEKLCEKGPTVFHPNYGLYLVGKYHVKTILSSVAKDIARWITKKKMCENKGLLER